MRHHFSPYDADTGRREFIPINGPAKVVEQVRPKRTQVAGPV